MNDEIRDKLHLLSIVIIIIPICLYLFGSFVAFDMNPMRWTILTHTEGRTCLLIFTIGYVMSVLKTYNEEF